DLRASEGIGLINRPHPIRMSQIARLTAFVRSHPHALQFSAHRAIHEEHAARMQRLQESRHLTPRIYLAGRHAPSPKATDTLPGTGPVRHADIATRQTPLPHRYDMTLQPRPLVPDASCGCAACSVCCDRP